jgi:hypothetical protein
MSTLSSSVSIEELKMSMELSQSRQYLSACSFETSSSQSYSISLIFMTSIFKTQLTNKYYVLSNTLF